MQDYESAMRLTNDLPHANYHEIIEPNITRAGTTLMNEFTILHRELQQYDE